MIVGEGWGGCSVGGGGGEKGAGREFIPQTFAANYTGKLGKQEPGF